MKQAINEVRLFICECLLRLILCIISKDHPPSYRLILTIEAYVRETIKDLKPTQIFGCREQPSTNPIEWSDLDNLNPLDDIKDMKERVKNSVGLSPEVIEYYRNVKQLDEIYSNLDEKDKKRIRDTATSLWFGTGESIS